MAPRIANDFLMIFQARKKASHRRQLLSVHHLACWKLINVTNFDPESSLATYVRKEEGNSHLHLGRFQEEGGRQKSNGRKASHHPLSLFLLQIPLGDLLFQRSRVWCIDCSYSVLKWSLRQFWAAAGNVATGTVEAGRWQTGTTKKKRALQNHPSLAQCTSSSQRREGSSFLPSKHQQTKTIIFSTLFLRWILPRKKLSK